MTVTMRSPDEPLRLPQLVSGLRVRASFAPRDSMAAGRVDALYFGQPLLLDAVEVWSSLVAVDADEALRFQERFGGPWEPGACPMFRFDPADATLTRVRSWATTTGFQRDLS